MTSPAPCLIRLLTRMTVLFLITIPLISNSQEVTKTDSGDSSRLTESNSRPCNIESHCRVGDFCFSAGNFSATVIQMSDGGAGNYRRIHLNLRFQNLTNRALVLAYHAGTSILTDDLGNTYSCCKAGGGPIPAPQESARIKTARSTRSSNWKQTRPPLQRSRYGELGTARSLRRRFTTT